MLRTAFAPVTAGCSRLLDVTHPAIVAFTAALCAACGDTHDAGSGPVPISQPPASPPPAAPPAGDAPVGGSWAGTSKVLGGGTQPIVGISDEDGRTYFLQDDGLMFWGKVTSSGSRISATLNVAPARGTTTTLWDGSSRGTATVSGTVQVRLSMLAEHTITSASGGRTTGTMTLNSVMSHGVNSSLELVAGNYILAFGEIGGILNITNQGDMFLQDPVSGCVVNGEIAIMNSNFNVYDVRMLVSNCTGSHSVLNGVTFGGVAEAIFENTFTYADGVLALVSGYVDGTPMPARFVFFRQ